MKDLKWWITQVYSTDYYYRVFFWYLWIGTGWNWKKIFAITFSFGWTAASGCDNPIGSALVCFVLLIYSFPWPDSCVRNNVSGDMSVWVRCSTVAVWCFGGCLNVRPLVVTLNRLLNMVSTAALLVYCDRRNQYNSPNTYTYKARKKIRWRSINKANMHSQFLDMLSILQPSYSNAH